MAIHPAEPDVGVCFLRSDQPHSCNLIVARWSSVVSTQYSTDIGNDGGVTVRSVEHLMAALRLARVDNALVHLDGPEVPALDGSAAPLLNLIEQAGTVDQDALAHVITVSRRVEVREGDRFVRLTPSRTPSWMVCIDYRHPAIGMQLASMPWDERLLQREIATARAFGFARDHAGLMEAGHALGATLTNTVVLDDDCVRNAEGLRYRDEFVRHKILDAIGDLSLAGCSIHADYEAFKPGHGLNLRLLKELFKHNPAAWTLEPPWDRKPASRVRWSSEIVQALENAARQSRP